MTDQPFPYYDDTFNHTRLRTFNGDHLTLPGASQVVQLHRHQKAGVWRILQTPNTLLAHVVGAGKTYTMVAAAEHKKDNTLTFEELGVDRIFVDEAHYFKNLFYLAKMTRIAGLPQTASERAFDMYLKVRHVQSMNSGGGVVFATGTPIANSMAEMFTMQRYLQPDDLKKRNLHHFDWWAATFGEPVTAMELSPDGAGYRLNTRFARFINVPELMQIFRQSADVQAAAMLNLPGPKLDSEKPADAVPNLSSSRRQGW